MNSFHPLTGEAFALTLNRAEAGGDARFALPADGWFQIARTGNVEKSLDLPGPKKESVRVRQVIDVADMESIVARFRQQAAAPQFSGLLVDFDHFSADEDKSTRAAAWIENVECRGSELWAQMRLSASGRAALEGGDYRHFSPVLGFVPRKYTEGETVHPAALLGGAITNQPTFRGMVPLSNRQDSATTPEITTMDYKAKLLALLGLPDTATDADIDAALAPATENMQNGKKFPETKCRLEKLEAAQIDTDLDGHGLKGEAREKWRVALTKNRDEGLALLATLGSDGSGYARTHNRDTAKAPAGGSAEKSLDERRSSAVEEYRTKNRCTFQAAWDAVRAASPALFAPEAKS
jgi:phage I-like protein